MLHNNNCAQRYPVLGTGQLGFDSLGDIVEDEGSPSPSLEHRSHFKAHRDGVAAAPGTYAGPGPCIPCLQPACTGALCAESACMQSC